MRPDWHCVGSTAVVHISTGVSARKGLRAEEREAADSPPRKAEASQLPPKIDGDLSDERLTARGASSPAKPALHIPEPFYISGQAMREESARGADEDDEGRHVVTSPPRSEARVARTRDARR